MVIPEITAAATPEEWKAGRVLIEEYASTLGIDLCFQNFGEERSNVPIMYGPPGGCLLLARRMEDFVGCVAVRGLDEQVCEMKRLYVRPEVRGSGLGRRLVEAAIEQAGKHGYRRIVLDTLPSMAVAQKLYQSCGFRPIEPYYKNPLEGASFLVLELS